MACATWQSSKWTLTLSKRLSSSVANFGNQKCWWHRKKGQKNCNMWFAQFCFAWKPFWSAIFQKIKSFFARGLRRIFLRETWLWSNCSNMSRRGRFHLLLWNVTVSFNGRNVHLYASMASGWRWARKKSKALRRRRRTPWRRRTTAADAWCN